MTSTTRDEFDVGLSTPQALAIAGGAALAYTALARRGALGGLAAAAAADLLRFGFTGRSAVLDLLREVDGETRIRHRILIDRPAGEVYAFWRDLENMPRFMHHLQEVRVVDDTRSRWWAKGPGGVPVRWTAEITKDEEGRRLSWRSTGDGDVDTWGRVRFEDAPGGRGTMVDLEMELAPPGGRAGVVGSRLLGRNPHRAVAGDLRRLKALLECGEIPTTTGQPTGPGARWSLASAL